MAAPTVAAAPAAPAASFPVKDPPSTLRSGASAPSSTDGASGPLRSPGAKNDWREKKKTIGEKKKKRTKTEVDKIEGGAKSQQGSAPATDGVCRPPTGRPQDGMVPKCPPARPAGPADDHFCDCRALCFAASL